MCLQLFGVGKKLAKGCNLKGVFLHVMVSFQGFLGYLSSDAERYEAK
jgi:hypothetical protein